uniref:Uncharacterized protein n=1 Tax=Anguilla anguilla TaxID=7936 RepID=A0A0E9VGF0_ANGAN
MKPYFNMVILFSCKVPHCHGNLGNDNQPEYL